MIQPIDCFNSKTKMDTSFSSSYLLISDGFIQDGFKKKFHIVVLLVLHFDSMNIDASQLSSFKTEREREEVRVRNDCACEIDGVCGCVYEIK